MIPELFHGTHPIRFKFRKPVQIKVNGLVATIPGKSEPRQDGSQVVLLNETKKIFAHFVIDISLTLFQLAVRQIYRQICERGAIFLVQPDIQAVALPIGINTQSTSVSKYLP